MWARARLCPRGQFISIVHLRLRLLQPVLHAHLAIHRRRGREVLLGLLALARAPVQLAEAEVAVGGEGAHAELLGERERVTVVSVSVLRGIAAGSDLSEETEGPRLVAALTALSGKGEGAVDEYNRLIDPVGEQARVAHVQDDERLVLLLGLLRFIQQRETLGNTPRQRVHEAQEPRGGP